MIFTIKCIRNDFYYKNALEMIFTIKMHYKWFLLWKCIGNDFDYKNALEIILLQKCIVHSLTNKFYFENNYTQIIINSHCNSPLN